MPEEFRRDPNVEPELRERVFQFRAAKDGDSIKGYASVWGELNSFGEVFVPGAFGASLSRKSDRKPMVMSYLHRDAIGRWTTHEEREIGLWLEGPISSTTLGRDAAILVDDGVMTGLSIGFNPEVWQFAVPGERVTFSTPFGERSYQFDDYVVYIVQADVVEAGLVYAPSDDEARLVRSRNAVTRAAKALPGLKDDASWEDVEYSMALLMGARGATWTFQDVPEAERHHLYVRVAGEYQKRGKQAPPFSPAPTYSAIEFRHDEREVFHDRYLRKGLDGVVAGVAGVVGQLSPETRERAIEARSALTTLLDGEPTPWADLAKELRLTTESFRTKD
jgi:HK97 family phage prohead protease